MFRQKFCDVCPWMYGVGKFIASGQLVKFNLFFEESQINDDLLPMSFAPSHTDDIDLETYITDVNDMQKNGIQFNKNNLPHEGDLSFRWNAK